MKHTAKFPLLATAFATAAVFSLQGAALAAPDATAGKPGVVSSAQTPGATGPDGAAQQGRWSDHGRRHAQRAAMWVPGYGPLGEAAVKVLALNDKQSKLLSDAQAAQAQIRDARVEMMKAERKSRLEQLQSGKVDPRGELKQSEEALKKSLEQRQAVEEKWLALWDSLDPAQKEKAATLLAERMERGGKHWKEGHRHHDGKPMHARKGERPAEGKGGSAPQAPSSAS